MSIVSSANPKWEDITTVSVEGTGLFDNLMYVIKEHLLQEYNAQRIRGADYTKAYIESIQAVLANTTQYIATTALNDLARQKLEVEIENLEIEREKLELERQKLALEVEDWTLRFPLERTKITVETSLITKQALLVQAQHDKARYEADYTVIDERNLIRAQIDQANYETNYVLVSQYNLTNARTVSENLQPTLINKQVSLLDKQIWGFEREAEYRVAKLQADIWSVARGTDDTLVFSSAFNDTRMIHTWGELYGRLQIPW